MSEQESITPPVRNFRIGAIKAAVWANPTEQGGTRYAVTFARTYRDTGGNWQQTASFNPEDLPVLQALTERALDAVLSLQDENDAQK